MSLSQSSPAVASAMVARSKNLPLSAAAEGDYDLNPLVDESFSESKRHLRAAHSLRRSSLNAPHHGHHVVSFAEDKNAMHSSAGVTRKGSQLRPSRRPRPVEKQLFRGHTNHLKTFGHVKVETLEVEESESLCCGLFKAPRARQFIKADGTVVREIEERRVAWDELFYDLIFVVVIASLTTSLAHSPSWRTLLLYVLTFSMVWLAWRDMVTYINMFVDNDVFHKLIIGLHMFTIVCVGASTVVSPDAVSHSTFAISVLASKILLLFLQFVAAYYVKRFRSQLLYNGIGGYIFSVFMFVSIFLDPGSLEQLILWAAGVFIEIFFIPLNVLRRKLLCPSANKAIVVYNIEHLNERYGLFNVIVLGELVAQVLFQITHDNIVYLVAFCGLVTALALKLIYFDLEGTSQYAVHALRWRWWRGLAWLYLHLPLSMSLAAAAGGLERLVALYASDENSNHKRAAGANLEYDPSGAWLLGGGLAAALLCLAVFAVLHKPLLNKKLSRKKRGALRVFGAVLVLLIAGFSEHLSTVTEVLLSALVIVLVAMVDAYGTLENKDIPPTAVLEEKCKEGMGGDFDSLGIVPSLCKFYPLKKEDGSGKGLVKRLKGKLSNRRSATRKKPTAKVVEVEVVKT